MADLYVGLMSGTSMDGIDVAIVDFSKITPRVIDFRTFEYPDELQTRINGLCASGDDEILRMGVADRQLAMAFCDAVNTLLAHNKLAAQDISAIGSHGQTIRHIPEGQFPFTLQIGDANTLAAGCGIDVIADFRKKDIALGGQGAPLAPAFHHAVFTDHECDRVIANIGGISNITYLPSDTSKSVIGFDTGPGNTLMDGWIMRHKGLAYDKDGAWAAQGQVDAELLSRLLTTPYINEPYPKSTGRELFNLHWLGQIMNQMSHQPDPVSVMATLAQFTARSIAINVQQLGDIRQVYVCGGGARNDFLMECLESELHESEIMTTLELGVHPDAVEAVAFAWLAYAHVKQLPGNLPSVTGARRTAILGARYPAD